MTQQWTPDQVIHLVQVVGTIIACLTGGGYVVHKASNSVPPDVAHKMLDNSTMPSVKATTQTGESLTVDAAPPSDGSTSLGGIPTT